MAIRIEHQPAGGAVAAAAYATGRNRARQRRLEDFLEMWEKGRRRGNIYRNAMGGGAQRIGQQQQGEWEDPLASATSPEERVQIAAQRRANARALRLGQAVPYQEAEMQFRPAPTKEELEQKKWERNVAYAETIHKRERTEKTEDLAKARTFEIKKSVFGGLQEQFKAIGQGGAESFTDPAQWKEYQRIKHNLVAGAADQKGAKQLTPTEYFNQGIIDIRGFLEGFDREKDLVPWEERLGNIRTTKEGLKQQKTREGDWQTVGLADEGVVTREQVDKGGSMNWRRTPLGGYQQRVVGRGGMVEWVDVEPPKEGGLNPEKRIALITSMAKAMTPQGEEFMSYIDKAEDAVDRLYGQGASGQPKVNVGDNGRPIVPEEPVQEAGQRQPAMPGAMTRQPEPQELPKLLDVIPQAEPARGMEPTPAPVGTPLTEVKPEPVMPTGLPVAPPQNRAAAGLIEKGYEYVPLLNSKGQPSGKRGWRPPTPEQTVRLRGGGQVSGRVYREGDNYHILSDAGKVSLSADQVEGVESGQRVFSGPEASVTGPQPAELAQVKTDADYERLPSGAEFIGPDGKRRRKP
jgi:hypothetical protein